MTSKFGFGQRESSRFLPIVSDPMLATWGRLRSAKTDALAQPKIHILKPFRYNVNRALIVGLGNPGKAYDGTRHNIGFRAVETLAKKHDLKFKKEPKFKGSVAEGKFGTDSVILLKPLTYMNLSGESVAQVMHYYQIDLSRLMVITDDVALPLGQLRIRLNSGSGGHNGLKSVEENLQTIRYARLKIGVSDRKEGELTDHVLGKFTLDEEKLLPGVLERVVQALEIWLDKGITSAMNVANSSTPSIGEEK